MFAQQGIFRIAVVVERDVFPVLRGMAAFAFLAKLALMPFFLVVRLVAAIAFLGQLLADLVDTRGYARFVAAFAAGFTVLAGQRKVGVLVVVKGGALPASFVMAAFAFVA